MFKASIALVLIAFAALAYGWIAGNDTVLYGSIGASVLAGLALLRSTMADRKAADTPGTAGGRERGRRERKAEAPEAAPAAGSRKGRGRPDSDEITQRLGIEEEDDGDLSSLATPTVKRIPSPSGKRPPRAPEGAAWANDDEDLGLGADEYDLEQGAHDAGFEDEGYAGDEAGEPAEVARQSAAAADDFRSRLAAVLGSAAPPETAPPPPVAPREEPSPPPKPPRARKAAQPSPPSPAADEIKPARRGRKKAQPVLPDAALTESPAAPEPQREEIEPDWIPIDEVPNIARATQPGGGFARPDPPQGMTPYRPRRPGVPKEPSGDDLGAKPVRRRAAPAEKTAQQRTRATAPKRTAGAGAAPATDVPTVPKPRSRPASTADPDAPPRRRGRPPKPKP